MGFDGFPKKKGDIPAMDIISELRAELNVAHREADELGADLKFARAELAAERERVEKLSQENAALRCDAAGGRERVAKLREALEEAAICLDGWDIEMASHARAVLKETE
jgi:predicted nuclease with TOPRIM domain